jgi:WD40 repeat protein
MSMLRTVIFILFLSFAFQSYVMADVLSSSGHRIIKSTVDKQDYSLGTANVRANPHTTTNKSEEKPLPRLMVQQGLISRVRSGVSVKGHARPAMSTSPDGTLLAVADGADIVLIEASSGIELRRIAAHSDSITDVIFSPDSTRLLSVATYDLKQHPQQMESPEEFIANSNKRIMDSLDSTKEQNDNDVSLTPSYQFNLGTVKLWDPVTGMAIASFTGLKGFVTFGDFCDNGSKVIAADALEIMVWDTSDGRPVSRVELPVPNMTIVGDVDHDCRNILTYQIGINRIVLVDPKNGKPNQEVETTQPVTAATFVRNTNLIAAGQEGGGISIMDLKGKSPPIQVATNGPYIRLLADSRNSSKLVAIDSKEEEVIVIDTSTGTKMVIRETGDGTFPRRYSSATITADGKSVITNSAVMKPTIAKWDTSSGRKIYEQINIEPDLKVYQFMTKDNDLCLAGSKISCWDLRSGKIIVQVDAPVGLWMYYPMLYNGALAVDAPNGKSLFGISGSTVQEIDYSTRAVINTYRESSVPLNVIGISRQGTKLAAGANDGTVRIWDTLSSKVVSSFRPTNRPLQSLVFSPDGNIVACGEGMARFSMFDQEIDRNVLTLWDVTTGKSLQELRGAATVQGVSFSNDGSMVVAGYGGGILAWDSKTGSLSHQMSGLTGGVTASLFLPDKDNILVTSNTNRQSIFWDVIAEKRLASIISLQNGSWLVVDPEGRFDTNNLEEITGLYWIMPDAPLKPLPLEIFMRDYYAPKLLSKRLKNANLPEVRSLASLNRTQPKVEIVGIVRESGPDNLVSVQVKVSSQTSQVQKAGDQFLQSGVYDLRLFRDGQMVWEWVPAPAKTDVTISPVDLALERWREQYRIIDTGEKVITIPHIRLPQRPGVTQASFTAYAFNIDRVKSETSPPFPWKIVPVAKPQPRYAYLITIATNANQSGWDLTLAVASAKLAAELWLKKLQPNYEVVPIVLESKIDDNGVILPNVTATKAHLRAVLDVLAGREKSVPPDLRTAVDPTGKLRTATPDDAVIVYIASHGYATPKGQFYVIPYDTGTQRGITEKLLTQCQQQPDGKSCAVANNFLDHAISSEELSSWWQGVDAGELVLVLDSCYSAAVPGQNFRPGPLGDRGFGQLSYDKGMRILAATQPDKTARATSLARLGHTLLVEALQSASQGQQDQSIADWLKATELVLPQKVRLLYPELKEDNLQLPELMDFAVAKRRLE